MVSNDTKFCSYRLILRIDMTCVRTVRNVHVQFEECCITDTALSMCMLYPVIQTVPKKLLYAIEISPSISSMLFNCFLVNHFIFINQ